jgi:hypothetical protein
MACCVSAKIKLVIILNPFLEALIPIDTWWKLPNLRESNSKITRMKI